MEQTITEEQAKSWARDKGTIFADPKDKEGLIADVGAAYEMAKEENNSGDEVAVNIVRDGLEKKRHALDARQNIKSKT